LKQAELEILPSVSWINLSDQLVKKLKLPKGTLFRIYPVVGSVENQDEEDQSYTITWEDGTQDWFDIVYDASKDTQGRSKQILMVDHRGRADTFIVPQTATVRQIRDLWKRFLEVPDDVELVVQTQNDAEFYWGYETVKEMVTYTFRAANFHGDMRVFGGSPHFEADQMCRLLDFKMPPFTKCHLTPRRGLGPSI
jgi:hypothetical protein